MRYVLTMCFALGALGCGDDGASGALDTLLEDTTADSAGPDTDGADTLDASEGTDTATEDTEMAADSAADTAEPDTVADSAVAEDTVLDTVDAADSAVADTADTSVADTEEPDASCLPGTHRCDDSCVPDDAVTSCGDRCEPCDEPLDGSAWCGDDLRCHVACDAGHVGPDCGVPTLTETLASLGHAALFLDARVLADGTRVILTRGAGLRYHLHVWRQESGWSTRDLPLDERPQAGAIAANGAVGIVASSSSGSTAIFHLSADLDDNATAIEAPVLDGRTTNLADGVAFGPDGTLHALAWDLNTGQYLVARAPGGPWGDAIALPDVGVGDDITVADDGTAYVLAAPEVPTAQSNRVLVTRAPGADAVVEEAVPIEALQARLMVADGVVHVLSTHAVADSDDQVVRYLRKDGAGWSSPVDVAMGYKLFGWRVALAPDGLPVAVAAGMADAGGHGWVRVAQLDAEATWQVTGVATPETYTEADACRSAELLLGPDGRPVLLQHQLSTNAIRVYEPAPAD